MNIEQNKWVLPAIQREFVWKPPQICELFESLMRGYPFGTFLFWKVEAAQSGEWKFYDFVRDFHEKDSPYCPDLGPISERALTAVLDGQQRLTALNIGLRGSISLRRKYGWKTDSNAYPKWYLFLNLITAPISEGDAEPTDVLTKPLHRFKFAEAHLHPYVPGRELWFRVGDILKLTAGPSMLKWLTDKSLQGDDLNAAFETLDRLHQVVHKDTVIYYYEESSAKLERVLSIFVRLNSSGTVLSQADLLHSIIVAQWSKRNAREEIASVLHAINHIGAWCGITQNVVLKAGLMLADVASVGFKVENFTQKNMALLESNWDRIRAALLLTVHLANDFGLDQQTIRAVSALLPIAYYLYRIEADDSYRKHTKFASDREKVRRWLIASLLKPSGIWGSGLDTLLTALREIIRDNSDSGFPTAKLRQMMAQRGKPLTFAEPEVEQLLDSDYNKKGTFLLLSLLYPFVDLRNKFHIDHIFPSSLLTRASLRKADVEAEKIEAMIMRSNRLANLQLMDGAENNEKRKMLPSDWMLLRFPDEAERKHHLYKHDLSSELPITIDGFLEFYESRRDRLRDRVREVLNGSHPIE
jgi:hypothetical protein